MSTPSALKGIKTYIKYFKIFTTPLVRKCFLNINKGLFSFQRYEPGPNYLPTFHLLTLQFNFYLKENKMLEPVHRVINIKVRGRAKYSSYFCNSEGNLDFYFFCTRKYFFRYLSLLNFMIDCRLYAHSSSQRNKCDNLSWLIVIK